MDERVKNVYNYLLEIGFKDITRDIVEVLNNSSLKSYKHVLDRMDRSSEYYYILERDNEIGFYTRLYVSDPEQKVIEKITGKKSEHNIRRLLSDYEDSIYCDLANGRERKDKKMDLQEATMLAITGKLVESEVISGVEYWRNNLEAIKNRYKKLDRSSSWYRQSYNNLIKQEKEAIRNLKRAIAEEKGTFISPATLTRQIQKLTNMEKYTDQTTSVRGFHWYGKGDFKVDTDLFNNTLNEENLYYEVHFFGKESQDKATHVKDVLIENGYEVSQFESTLRVTCYKN